MALYLTERQLPRDKEELARYYQASVVKGEHEGTVPEPRRDMDPRIAAALGLDPNRAPSTEELARLMEGKRTDGAALPGPARELSFIDLTFSADKSVSVAWALAPTEAERALIHSAHRHAVEDAMEYVESEIGRARIGKRRDKAERGSIAWLGFDHFTARPVLELARTDAQGRGYTELLNVKSVGDPQVHTHVVVPNFVMTASGKAKSLDFQRLEGRVMEFGAYYQARLATHLRAHGVAITPALDERKGAARIEEIPEHVRKAMSKRTNGAEQAARDYAAKQGVDWDTLDGAAKSRLVQASAFSNRKSKGDGLDDLAVWQAEAKALGYTHRSVLRPGAEISLAPRAERLETAYRAALPLVDDELQRRAVLTGSDMRVLATRGLIASGVEHWSEIGTLTRVGFRERGVTQDGKHTALLWAQEFGRNRGPDRTTVTTALHESQETEVIALARKAAADKSRALTPEQIAKAAEGRLDLSTSHGQQQRTVMERLGAGGRFGVAIGVAGAGKTTLIGPLVAAWKAEGRDIHGIALAWRQTEDLAGAGITQRAAMAKFLHPSYDKSKLGQGSVVVIDEIGQVGTRQLLNLLRLQDKHGFQVVALGDDKQCQSVDAGPTISLLERALGKEAIPEILSSIRQRTEQERATTLLFREGKAAEALAAKRGDGTAQLVPGDHRAAVQHVAALWKARTEANRHDPEWRITISAPTNAEAREIGAAIREQRRAMGEVGPDRIVVKAADQTGQAYDLPLAVGDRVRLFSRAPASIIGKDGRAHGGLIGNNGSVVNVVEIEERRLKLRTAEGTIGWVKLSSLHPHPNNVRHGAPDRPMLSWGEALTIDAIQGVSSHEHINAMPSGTRTVNGFKGYTGGSRHFHTNWLVVSDGAERQEVKGRRPMGDLRPIREQDVWDNMARNLSRQPTKDYATAFLERAKGTLRRSEVQFQVAAQRREAGRDGALQAGVATRARLVRQHAARVVKTASARASHVMAPVIAATENARQRVGRRMGR